MNGKGLKIALIVSIALNLFMLGAVAAGYLVGQKAFRERVNAMPLFVAARDLPEAEQTRLKASVREAMADARGDFRDARQARRRAVELAGAPRYDKAAVLSALAEARAAEMRGRARLETRLAESFTEFDVEARRKLAPSIARPPRGGRHRMRLRDPRPDDGAPPAPPPQ